MAFDPTANPELLDFAVIGGMSTQDLGLVYVEGFSKPRKWDEQPGYGLDGNGLKLTGLGLSEGQLRINAWLPKHFTAFAVFQKAVLSTTTGGTNGTGGVPTPTSPGLRPLDFRHPMTDDLDIRSVVITDEGQWTLAEDTGLWERVIKLRHYRKPTPMLALPASAIDKPPSDDEAPTKEELQFQSLQNTLNQAKEEDAKVP